AVPGLLISGSGLSLVLSSCGLIKHKRAASIQLTLYLKWQRYLPKLKQLRISQFALT
ncbi:hypothetical protein PanWU01x14_075860, partial [Parasponia andersonii]